MRCAYWYIPRFVPLLVDAPVKRGSSVGLATNYRAVCKPYRLSLSGLKRRAVKIKKDNQTFQCLARARPLGLAGSPQRGTSIAGSIGRKRAITCRILTILGDTLGILGPKAQRRVESSHPAENRARANSTCGTQGDRRTNYQCEGATLVDNPVDKDLKAGSEADGLRRLDKLSQLLDNAFAIPGTRFRIGLDGIIGLIPGIGDAAGAVLSIYVIAQAARLGLPVSALLRMVGNVALETVVGAVPIVGDIFDIVWKANTKNMALLRRHRPLAIAKARTPSASRN